MCVDEAGVGLHTSIRKSGWICGMRCHQWGRSGHGHPGKKWQFIWHSWRAIGSAIFHHVYNCLQLESPAFTGSNHPISQSLHRPSPSDGLDLFQDLTDPHVFPLPGRKLCGTRMISGDDMAWLAWFQASLLQVLGWRRLKSWTVNSGRHWSSRLGSKPFAEISPNALTASGKTGGKPGTCLWQN